MQKILVVDDAEWNRELLHEILKDEYMVEMAEKWLLFFWICICPGWTGMQ